MLSISFCTHGLYQDNDNVKMTLLIFTQSQTIMKIHDKMNNEKKKIPMSAETAQRQMLLQGGHLKDYAKTNFIRCFIIDLSITSLYDTPLSIIVKSYYMKTRMFSVLSSAVSFECRKALLDLKYIKFWIYFSWMGWCHP